MGTKKKSTESRKRQPAGGRTIAKEKYLAEYRYLLGKLNSAIGTIAGAAEHYPRIAALLILPVVEASERGAEDLRKVVAGLMGMEEFLEARRAIWRDFKKQREPLKAARHQGS